MNEKSMKELIVGLVTKSLQTEIFKTSNEIMAAIIISISLPWRIFEKQFFDHKDLNLLLRSMSIHVSFVVCQSLAQLEALMSNCSSDLHYLQQGSSHWELSGPEAETLSYTWFLLTLCFLGNLFLQKNFYFVFGGDEDGRSFVISLRCVIYAYMLMVSHKSFGKWFLRNIKQLEGKCFFPRMS